jgi:hypothetical protein
VSVLEDGRSHAVNFLEGKGIAVSQVRTVLLQVAETTRVFHEPLPKPWKDLREKIRGMGTTKKYIAWVEYKEMCKQYCIKGNMVLVVTSFLNEPWIFASLVQGVISKDLFSRDYLWPGTDTLFLRKVAGRMGRHPTNTRGCCGTMAEKAQEGCRVQARQGSGCGPPVHLQNHHRLERRLLLS